MVFATVIMCMVYLTTETRTRVGEKGINDPPVKLLVTFLTFLALWAMTQWRVLDPSAAPADVADELVAGVAVVDPRNVDLPLPKVCYVQAYWQRGLFFFSCIMCGCLSFVIFVTSKQSLAGLRHFVGGPPPPPRPTKRDRLLGQALLFLLFLLVCVCIMLFFAFTPLYSQAYPDQGPNRPRNTTGWLDACNAYDETALRLLGIA